MIAVDTNILVYAHRKDSDFHPNARDCIRGLAEGRTPWFIPWTCILEFYAIVTHPKIFRPPSSPAQAIEQISVWLESPTLSNLSEGEFFWKNLSNLLIQSNAKGPTAHDARIAALCLEHQVSELWSADRDFSRFAGLAVKNPLI